MQASGPPPADLAALSREVMATLEFVTRKLLARDDQRVLAEMLPLVHALVKDAIWDAAFLAEAARSTGSAELVALIAEYETEQGGLRSFGGMLARAAGCSVGGLRLVQLGPGRAGLLYQVVQLSGR